MTTKKINGYLQILVFSLILSSCGLLPHTEPDTYIANTITNNSKYNIVFKAYQKKIVVDSLSISSKATKTVIQVKRGASISGSYLFLPFNTYGNIADSIIVIGNSKPVLKSPCGGSVYPSDCIKFLNNKSTINKKYRFEGKKISYSNIYEITDEDLK